MADTSPKYSNENPKDLKELQINHLAKMLADFHVQDLSDKTATSPKKVEKNSA